ncbi:Transmembrane osmosensor [Scheffersomyces spartinae]|uniref:High osmolarity signaling protein SHO1 n=1 Tax=Scheffersomyces spartinae TaxID=45513 RepID=A0A9P8AKM4_9ASCO|nr:Transmembrane osmosensor [Scheffersomyces spartinae]KAG7196082.1 Transmembrane osmosensor [Scheffersomyces spartinae]
MGFRFSNFYGDPFAIATISFGIIAWVVAIAGAFSSPSKTFPHFSWWGLFYQLFLHLLIFTLYACNLIELYKFTIVGLLSIAFVYTSNSANTLIYNTKLPGNLCCAAGCILLSILNFIWILYFGGHPESPTNQFIDSFSLKSTHSHGQLALNDPNAYDRNHDSRHISTGVSSTVQQGMTGPSAYASQQYQDTQAMRQSNKANPNMPYMSSTHLNGLENFSQSDVRDLTHGNHHSIRTGTAAASGINGQNTTGSNTNNTGTLTSGAGIGDNGLYNDVNSLGMGTTFRYRAKALYTYEANPDDINELSFTKGEILEVDDIDGKWWQARRANGQVGICPSNYVKLLD